MGLDTGRIVNYLVFDNPVSKCVLSLFNDSKPLTAATTSVNVINEKIPLWKLVNECGPLFRIGALFGATAVAIGAYGAHRSYPKDREEQLRNIYQAANRYHFYHTFALLFTPLCRNPKAAAALFMSGIILFSGSSYYYAFTGDNKLEAVTPVGGTILIFAWLSMGLRSTLFDG